MGAQSTKDARQELCKSRKEKQTSRRHRLARAQRFKTVDSIATNCFHYAPVLGGGKSPTVTNLRRKGTRTPPVQGHAWLKRQFKTRAG